MYVGRHSFNQMRGHFRRLNYAQINLASHKMNEDKSE